MENPDFCQNSPDQGTPWPTALTWYGLFKSQRLMENHWSLPKFAWPRHSLGLAPSCIGVRFHSFNRMCDWDPKGSSHCNPSSYLSQEQFPGSTFHQNTPLSLNKVFLNPRDWWKTFMKISLTKALLGLAPRSIRVRSIPSIACRIDIRKVLLIASRTVIRH